MTVLALLSVDDCFTGSLSSSAAAVNEGSAVTYTATLNKVSATDLNIPYTLGGTATLTADYTGSVASTGNIKIVAGALTGTLVLTAVPDAKTEGAETVSVALGAAAAVTTTINDTSLTATVPVNTAPINISATLLTGTATTGVDEFNIASGNYAATIAGFNNGDKLGLFAGRSITVVSDASQTDGIQVFTLDDTATGAKATITLTGLTAAKDGALFNEGSFVTAFGAGTLVSTITGAVVTPPATTSKSISATLLTGTATTGVDTFNIASGNYAATIADFSNGDKLSLFKGRSITVVSDASQTDGIQVFTLDDTATGAKATITLTGLTAAQDGALFNEGSFATAFGTGTLI